MKNSIKILSIALIAFSNVILAENGNLNSKTELNLSKIKKAKFVTYANPKLINSEIGSLVGYSKKAVNQLTENSKVVEKPLSDLEGIFVAYADENLQENETNFGKTSKLVHEIILKDAQIIESNWSEKKSSSYINYADAKLINSEIGFLTIKKHNFSEIVKLNSAIIENKISNTKLKSIKNYKYKKTSVVINSRKY